jgi:hypothetical protein
MIKHAIGSHSFDEIDYIDNHEVYEDIHFLPEIKASLLDSLPLKDESGDDYIKRAYTAYHKTVNMSVSSLKAWAEKPDSKYASLSRAPITRNIRLLSTPREQWTVSTARSAMRTVSFVERMKGVKATKTANAKTKYSKRVISLKNWAYNPGTYL